MHTDYDLKKKTFQSLPSYISFPPHGGARPYAIVALILLYAISYPFSIVTIDTGRDWALAYQIASGSSFPAEGPVFKEVIHFGPVWFYLLGLFLFITKTVTGTLFLLGCLAAMKFWLAYAAGKALINWQFGLLWCFALALPSWSFMTQVTLTAINYIEVTTLWVIYTLVRYHKSRNGVWLVHACFAYSMALHAHPSTSPLGLIILTFYGYHFFSERQLIWRLLFAGLFVFLLPFVPYLISQYLQGWADLKHVLSYVESDVNLSVMDSVSGLFTGTVLLPAQVIVQYLIPDYGLLRDFWIGAVYLLYAVGLLGVLSLVFDQRHRALFIICLACLVLIIPILLIIRIKTTFYMVFVLIPFISGLWALNVSSLLQRIRMGSGALLDGSILLIFMLFASTTAMIIQTALDGYGSFPRGVLMDIKKPGISLDNAGYGMRFPSYLHDNLNTVLCNEDGISYLHGDLAFITDTSYGIGFRLHCNRPADNLRIIGQDDTSEDVAIHIAALQEAAWHELDVEPEQWLGKLGVTTPKKVINPSRGHRLPPLDLYPPHEWEKHIGPVTNWQFSAEQSDVLVISNVIFWYIAAQIIEVTANGKKLTPLHQSAVSTLYRCNNCKVDAPVLWDLKITTPKPEWIDIFTLSGSLHQ